MTVNKKVIKNKRLLPSLNGMILNVVDTMKKVLLF